MSLNNKKLVNWRFGISKIVNTFGQTRETSYPQAYNWQKQNGLIVFAQIRCTFHMILGSLVADFWELISLFFRENCFLITRFTKIIVFVALHYFFYIKLVVIYHCITNEIWTSFILGPAPLPRRQIMEHLSTLTKKDDINFRFGFCHPERSRPYI